jgi:hypothetical protein
MFFICKQDWWKFCRNAGSLPANIKSESNGFPEQRGIRSPIAFSASASEPARFYWKKTDAVSTAGSKKRRHPEQAAMGRARLQSRH